MTFKKTFGTWLISQKDRYDQIGELADAFECFIYELKISKHRNTLAKDFKKPSDFYNFFDLFDNRYCVKMLKITAYSAAKEYSAYRRKINLKILLPRQSYRDTMDFIFDEYYGKNVKPIRFCMPGQWDRYINSKCVYLDQ